MPETTNSEYQRIREEFAYDRNKLDIKSAETTDTLSGVESAFLATLDSQPADKFYITGEWIYQHFIDANYLVSKFIKNGLVEISNTRSLKAFTVPELKELLKENGIKATGTKDALIKAAQNLPQKNNGKEYLRITDKGKSFIVEKGVFSRDAEMEKHCIELILENKLAEAFQYVCKYESDKLIGRGIGTDWSKAEYKPHFTMKTKLPFKLHDVLIPYEAEMRAAAIYANMMGKNNARPLFLARNEIAFDKALLDAPLHAMMMLTMGIKPPEDFQIKDSTDSKWVYTENALEQFVTALKQKGVAAGLKESDFTYSTRKDGSYDFSCNNSSLGRLQLGKRSSRMQVTSVKEKKMPHNKFNCLEYFVTWYENESLETYISLIDKWISAYEIEKKDKEKL